MRRRSFIAAAAGESLLTALPLRSASQPRGRAGRRALVLVGGANRGAYEAGAIQAIVEREGISDGEPIGYDLVCGTSIGALNAYLVATAQYGALRTLWQSVIAGQNVFRLKHPYELIPDPRAAVFNRLDAALQLGKGLTSNVAGVLDPAPVRALLDFYVKTDAPVHVPLYISTTNLTKRINQMFVRKATTAAGLQKQQLNDALLSAYPKITRAADDSILHDVMFATACLPLVFDPVLIPRGDGSQQSDQYVDGGVTSNVPIRIAQLCVDTLHVVVVNPPVTPDVDYQSALQVGLGVFETMQTIGIQYQVRLAFAASTQSLPFSPFIIQPAQMLPGKGSDFNDQAALTAMWNLGYEDGKRGWQRFVPPEGVFSLPY